MKKALSLVAALALTFCLASCGSTEPDPICGTWQATSAEQNGKEYHFGSDANVRPVWQWHLFGDGFSQFAPASDIVDLFMVVNEDGTAYLYTDDAADGDKTVSWEATDNGGYSFDGNETVLAGDSLAIAVEKENGNSLRFERVSDE